MARLSCDTDHKSQVSNQEGHLCQKTRDAAAEPKGTSACCSIATSPGAEDCMQHEADEWRECYPSLGKRRVAIGQVHGMKCGSNCCCCGCSLRSAVCSTRVALRKASASNAAHGHLYTTAACSRTLLLLVLDRKPPSSAQHCCSVGVCCRRCRRLSRKLSGGCRTNAMSSYKFLDIVHLYPYRYDRASAEMLGAAVERCDFEGVIITIAAELEQICQRYFKCSVA